MTWTVVYRDTDKTIERRPTDDTDDMGSTVFEERTTWHNPHSTEARLNALTEAVDTLILDSLGGL